MKLRCFVCGSAVERVPDGRWACIECGANYYTYLDKQGLKVLAEEFCSYYPNVPSSVLEDCYRYFKNVSEN